MKPTLTLASALLVPKASTAARAVPVNTSFICLLLGFYINYSLVRSARVNGVSDDARVQAPCKCRQGLDDGERVIAMRRVAAAGNNTQFGLGRDGLDAVNLFQ